MFFTTHFTFQFDFSAIHDRVSINQNSEVRKNIKQSAFANLLFTRLKKNISEISEFEIHETL